MSDSLDALKRRLEAATAARERIDAARQARDAAERAKEQAEAELHAKLRERNPAYPGAFTELDDTKQNRMVVAPQLRNAGQLVIFTNDPDYRPIRVAESAYRHRQAEFEAALKARLPAGWEGDLDAPDFISLADVEPWLAALLNRIRALRDFQPSGDAAVSLTACDLRNVYRILDHLEINDRPTRPPAPADVHQAEAAISDLLAWVRRRLSERTRVETIAELRARLVAVRNRVDQIAKTVLPNDYEHEGDSAGHCYDRADKAAEKAVRDEFFTLLLGAFAPLADRIIDTLGTNKFPTDRLPPTQEELAEKLPRHFVLPHFRPERLDMDLFGLSAPDLTLAGKLILVWAKWAKVPGRDRPPAYRDREYLPWAGCLVNRYREDLYTWRVLVHPFDWAIRAFDEVATGAAGQLSDSLAQLAAAITSDAADQRARREGEAQHAQARKAMDEAAEQAYHFRNIEAADFRAWERRIVAFVESCKAAGHEAALAESISHFAASSNNAERYTADVVRQAVEDPGNELVAKEIAVAFEKGFIRAFRDALEGACSRATQPRRESAKASPQTGPQPPTLSEPAAPDEMRGAKVPGRRLSPGQQNIVDAIREAGHRLSQEEVIAALEAKHGAASIGTTKNYLAALVKFGILTSRRDVDPPGYGLAEWL